jgi:aminocarboxymuconate-semialdehyde decarboxylase
VKVDIHAHFFPEISRTDRALLGEADAPWLRDDGDGTGFIMVADTEFRPVDAPLWDPAARLAAMDEHGVAVEVISATPILFGYHASVAAAVSWSRFVNDRAAEMCAHDPARLRPLCQAPLQDIDAACTEVSRARASGHVGVHIGNHVGDRNLDDPGLVRFLHHCADEDIPVFVHPWDMMAGERMPKYMLQWLVGMPAETHLAILSLILSGAFERLPRHLKLCFAHGGGNFAAQLGRVDNAWHRRDIVRADCPDPPSSYADRFSVDSAVFSEHALQLLTTVMGVDRVMLGSDYPFPLGEIRPGKIIDDAPFLTAADKRKLLAGNAAAFFGIDLDFDVDFDIDLASAPAND